MAKSLRKAASHHAALYDASGDLVAQTLPSAWYQDALYRAIMSHREGCDAVCAYIHSPDGTQRKLVFATQSLRKVVTGE